MVFPGQKEYNMGFGSAIGLPHSGTFPETYKGTNSNQLCKPLKLTALSAVEHQLFVELLQMKEQIISSKAEPSHLMEEAPYFT